jgi:branched-chain amino acid transport system permease protein
MAIPSDHPPDAKAKTILQKSQPLISVRQRFGTIQQQWNSFFGNTKLGPFPLNWYFTGWRAGILWLVIAFCIPSILGELSSINYDMFAQQQLLTTFCTMGIYALLALGLNIVVGYAGLLDLGYVAFFVLGSYTAAAATGGIIADSKGNVIHIPQVSFWWVLLLGIAIAGIFGIILGAPTLRLRGDYLAIVTLGFGEIVPIVFKNIPYFFGAYGISALPPAPIETPVGIFDLGDVLDRSTFYYFLIIVLAIVITLTVALRQSSLGRAWIAIREDEIAASASGINLVRVKLIAFGLGAAFGGLAGVLNAVFTTTIDPNSFNFNISISVLVMIVLGGIGSIPGVLLGAGLLVFIDQFLLGKINDSIHSDLLIQSKPLMYGLILLAVILLRPQGLIPNLRRQRELQGIGIASEGLSVVGEITREELGEGDEPPIEEESDDQ